MNTYRGIIEISCPKPSCPQKSSADVDPSCLTCGSPLIHLVDLAGTRTHEIAVTASKSPAAISAPPVPKKTKPKGGN